MENSELERLADVINEKRKSKDKEDKKEEKKKTKKGIWEKVWNKNKLKKPSKVAVLYLRESGLAETMELEAKRGFFNINDRTYHERRDCVYLLGKEKIPLCIIPEWNVTPIGKKAWEDKPMQEKFSVLQDHVMKGIRHAERVRMGEKGNDFKFNAKSAIGIAIAVVIVIAVVVGYL